MLSIVIFYLILLSAIYYLPEKHWEKSFTLLREVSQFCKNRWSQKKSQDVVSKARACERYLIELESSFAAGNFENRLSLKKAQIASPEFGFYTELVDVLLEKYRQMGIPLKEILHELKLNLTKEIQFELKCASIANNTYFQFVMMAAVTWGFIFFTNTMIELSLSYSDFGIILFLQMMGSYLFVNLAKRLKRRHFRSFDNFIKKIYIFLCFLEVNASQSRALAESQILQIEDLSDERFLPCAFRLEDAINKWKDLGLSPKNESRAVIVEIWNLKEQTFNLYIRQFEGLKFSILALFYLPAYFYYLYAIFQFFMEQ